MKSPRFLALAIALVAIKGTPCANAATAPLRITRFDLLPAKIFPEDDGTGYQSRQSDDELQVYRGGHHFLTFLTTDGIFAIRPHPGIDVNG